MGLRKFSVYSEVDVAPVTTAETVIATLAGVSTSQPGQTVSFAGTYSITTAASTTALVTRIRQDSLAGAVVGEAQTDTLFAAAGSTEQHEIYRETGALGEFSGRTFVMTVSCTAAAANATVNNAGLEAEVYP